MKGKGVRNHQYGARANEAGYHLPPWEIVDKVLLVFDLVEQAGRIAGFGDAGVLQFVAAGLTSENLRGFVGGGLRLVVCQAKDRPMY